jgi:hypothetical protein
MEDEQLIVMFNDSAFRHNCTEADIRHAIDTWLYDDLWDDKTDKYLLIGFDMNGNLLEVMYNTQDRQTLNVFMR